MNADELIARIMGAHEIALRLQREQQEAAGDRRQLIREAMAANVSVAAIASALGVDRQRIYQMAK